MQEAWAGSTCVVWFAQAGLFSSTVTEILPLHILWEAPLESQCWGQGWGAATPASGPLQEGIS